MPPKKKTVAAAAAAAAAEAPAAPEAAEVTPTPVPVAAEEPVATEVAANEEAAAPAIVVAGTPTEMYAQLQVVVASDASRINDHVAPLLELMHAAEDPASPILLRVRFLEFIGKTVASLRDNNALKKIVTSLVKIISGEDNTPQLLIAALHCFPGLGPVSTMDKRWEYLSREGADILMQVIIARDSFPENVRQAARKSLDALTDTAFRSVVTKLLHWLSDDREEDEEEQIRRERHLALDTLSRLALAHSMKKHWTDETQEYVLSLIYRVLGIVDAREFAQLARIAASLPIVSANHGIQLLESFLADNKLDSERNIEAAAIISRFVRPGTKKGETEQQPVEFDLVAPMEAAGLLAAGGIDGESRRSMLVARVLLLAARLANADIAEKLLPLVTSAILSLVGDDGNALPENLTTLEALLFAAVAVATKKSAEMLVKLNEEGFNAAMTNLSNATAALEPELIFAVKKVMRDGKAGPDDAEAIACLHNIQAIASSFAAKHVPMGEIKESWAGRAQLPVIKRGRGEGNKGALPPPPGTAAANDRSRVANRGRGGNNRNNNNNNSNNNSHRRAHSGSRQPAKRQRTSTRDSRRRRN